MPPQSDEVLSDPARRTMRPSLETASVWALLATIVLALFIGIPSAWISLTTAKTFVLAAGTLITLALYLGARLSKGGIATPPLALVGALWLPAIAYALSTLFSGVTFTGAFWGAAFESDTLAFMLIAAMLGTLAALILRRAPQYRLFLKVGGYAFCVIVIFEMLTVIAGQFVPNTIPPSFSIVGSFTDLGFVLGLGVVIILITLRFLELPPRTARMLSIVGVGALFLIAVANSGLVWVLLSLVSLGLAVDAVMMRGAQAEDADYREPRDGYESVPQREARRHPLFLPLAVLAVSLFFLVGGMFNSDQSGQSALSLGDRLTSALHVNSLDLRPDWPTTLSVGRQTYANASWFGSGPSTFGIEWLRYRDASLNATPIWNMDFTTGVGVIATSFVTTGMIGVIAWVGFLALFILLGLRMLIWRTPQDAHMRYFAMASFVGALYLFAIAFFDVPNAVIIALAFVFAGLFASTMRFSQRGAEGGIAFTPNPRLGFLVVFSLIILLIASAVSAFNLAQHIVASVELGRATAAFAQGDLDQASKMAQSSLSFAPRADAYQLQAIVANARLQGIMASSTMDTATAQKAFQATFSDGVNAALSDTKLDAMNYRSWIVLGNLFAQAVSVGAPDAYDNAKSAYQRAQMLNPTSPQIPYLLAQLEVAHKDTKTAEGDLKTALALKSDYTDALLLLSQVQATDGNVKDALDTALAAAQYAPNNPTILFQIGLLYAAQSNYTNAAAALQAAVAANPKFVNARYILAAVYAKQNDLKNALVEIQAIADMSSDNAQAVASELSALKAGKNPFPANLLSVSPTSVRP